MRKILCLCIIMAVSMVFSACEQPKIKENVPETEAVTEKVIEIGTDAPDYKKASEYSEDEIYSAFEEALDFYICWIYGQAYAEDMYKTEDNLYRARIQDGFFESAEELNSAIEGYFETDLAEQYVEALNATDESDGVYINVVEGVGDNGEYIVGHTFEKYDEDYLLVLYIKSYFLEDMSESRYISCRYENGRWLFGDADEDVPYFGKCEANVAY